MSHNRNLDYLIKRRIIYRRSPTTDRPTESFDWGDYYEDGTYQCYELFRSKAKITTYKSLKWHLYVLWYLNTSLTQDEFEELASFICEKEHGFITFNVSQRLLSSMIYDVSMQDLERPPANKIRKIIFKDSCGLDAREKMRIVGQMVGKRKLSEAEIYDAMLFMHDEGDKITIARLSSSLGCSPRTIHRNMSVELKKEKELLNQELCND